MTLRILIAEADASNAKLVSVILRQERFETRIVSTLTAALNALDEFAPHGVVFEVPALANALAFIRTVKAENRWSRVVLIAVSGSNGPHMESSLLGAGCAAFVKKPIDPLTFGQMVRDNLGGLQ